MYTAACVVHVQLCKQRGLASQQGLNNSCGVDRLPFVTRGMLVWLNAGASAVGAYVVIEWPPGGVLFHPSLYIMYPIHAGKVR